MNEVRIGVIGVGIIGKSHIDEYAKIPGAKVVAVADIDEEEAQPGGRAGTRSPMSTPIFASSWSGTISTPSTSAFTTISTPR